MKSEYIRGWRQLKAIPYFIECLLADHPFQSKLLCAKRELQIFFGFAKPYKVVFAPSFWKSAEKYGIRLGMDWIKKYEETLKE